MRPHIINFSIKNKFIVLLFIAFIMGFGLYSLFQISIGAVSDVTNNQVQVVTTSCNLSTKDMEQFITYPVEMANLSDLVEIRCISKFGLSVITIVFEDNMGTFLPGMFVKASITTNSTLAMPLPESAVVTSNSKEYLIILHHTTKGEYVFKKVEVNIGSIYEGNTQL